MEDNKDTTSTPEIEQNEQEEHSPKQIENESTLFSKTDEEEGEKVVDEHPLLHSPSPKPSVQETAPIETSTEDKINEVYTETYSTQEHTGFEERSEVHESVNNEVDIEQHGGTDENTLSLIDISDMQISIFADIDPKNSAYVIVLKRDNEKPNTTKRRYRHFESLRSYLVTEYPSILIPPLPLQSMVIECDRAQEVMFAELQRKPKGRLLEFFLHQIQKHPVLCKDKMFLDFVTISEHEFEAKMLFWKKLDASRKPTGLAFGLKSMFTGDERDHYTQHEMEKLKQMRAALIEMYNASKKFTQANLSYYNEFDDVGKAFKIVGNADKKCGKEFHAVGDAMMKIYKQSKLWQPYEKTRHDLSLTDAVGMCTLAIDALKDYISTKSRKKKEVDALKKDYESQRLKYEKLLASSQSKAEAFKPQLDATKLYTEKIAQDVEDAEKNIHNELEKFYPQQKRQLASGLLCFLHTQKDFANQKSKTFNEFKK